MKTADFREQISPNGQIDVPPGIASQVPCGEQLEVVLHWGASDNDATWRAAGRARFEVAYCSDDSVYEQLNQDARTVATEPS